MKLTDDERFVITHITRWGSDGYPINKRRSGWTWGPIRSIKRSPIVYKTKREAIAAFEAYHDSLLERHRQETIARAQLPNPSL